MADDRSWVLEQVHESPGRIRLRAAATKTAEDMAALADRLAKVEGVDHVIARPNTGSVILSFAVDIEQMRARLAAEPDLRLVRPANPPPVQQMVQLGIWKLDSDIKSHTGNALDLRTGIAVALLATAAVQMVRGRIAGPATTLALAAFSLLESGKGK